VAFQNGHLATDAGGNTTRMTLFEVNLPHHVSYGDYLVTVNTALRCVHFSSLMPVGIPGYDMRLVRVAAVQMCGQ